LHADNVELLFTRVDKVTETGVVGKDGSHRDFDVIIWATGYLG
jgi:NADH dehydrogenase FAD-containing subunit